MAFVVFLFFLQSQLGTPPLHPTTNAPLLARQHFPKLQARQSGNFPRGMVIRHLHVESATTVAQVLSSEHSALLANEECSRVRVAADVVGADGEIGDLEALDAVDIEALIQDTVLDD